MSQFLPVVKHFTTKWTLYTFVLNHVVIQLIRNIPDISTIWFFTWKLFSLMGNHMTIIIADRFKLLLMGFPWSFPIFINTMHFTLCIDVTLIYKCLFTNITHEFTPIIVLRCYFNPPIV